MDLTMKTQEALAEYKKIQNIIGKLMIKGNKTIKDIDKMNSLYEKQDFLVQEYDLDLILGETI